MILIIYFILLICFFSTTYKEGLNLRKNKYDSFFKRNHIQNDKEKSILTYQNKSVKYKYLNKDTYINEKSIVKKILMDNAIPTSNYYVWNPSISVDHNMSNLSVLKRPLVIKPDIGHQGVNVTTDIMEDKDILKKVNKLIKMNATVLIEEQIQGYKEYRVTVLNDVVIGATEKISASISGDGTHSILELIDEYNKKKDYKIHTVDYNYIKQQGYTKNDILPHGVKLKLTNVANMSNGSEIKNVDLDLINPMNAMMFKQINQLLTYQVSGIDYLGDLSVPYMLMGSVIEVNPAPGIDIHYNVVKNKNTFLKSIVDNLFK
uniref:ATP-grasp domain-containing protein n=1 Tax=viral metagenome TaxID=1070528 RepID=A0A6C0B9M2_9ZZZZ